MIKKIALLTTCFFLLACPQKDDDFACTNEFVYGISVKVTDAVSGDEITEDIVVTIQDDDYIEQLMAFGDASTFVGAGERLGTYEITVTGVNYEEYISEPITVSGDICHVTTEFIEIALQPL